MSETIIKAQTETAQPAPQPTAAAPDNSESWFEMLCVIARHHGINFSEEHLKHTMAWHRGMAMDKKLRLLARDAGMQISISKSDLDKLPGLVYPLIAETTDKTPIIIYSVSPSSATISLPQSGGMKVQVTRDQLKSQLNGYLVLLQPYITTKDERVDEFLAPYQKNWFWRLISKEKRVFGEVALASMISNMLALATSLFSMQIYDRVIPAQSYPTLWVLSIGVFFAVIIDLFLRMVRTQVTDYSGKRLDLALSSLFYARALDIKSEARPKSTGTFMAQLREVESVRELLTSTTISAIADLPFVFMFIFVMWLIAGPMSLVSLAVLPLIIIPGFLIQRPLARLSKEGMREGSMKSGLLVESIEKVDDIKMMQAESRFLQMWNRFTAVGAKIGSEQRFISALLMNWTASVQQFAFMAIMIVGTYLVLEGSVTTGTLIACSILSGRAISPLSQLASVFGRWQSAKVAREGLNEILKKPTDHGKENELIHRANIRGHYVLNQVKYKYMPDDQVPVLTVPNLQIMPGEKIAILGRTGAGKSTLLRLLTGLAEPSEGKLLLDDLDLKNIDPSDVRRDVGYLSQDSGLFHGTIRDNLLIGAPLATEQQILEALQVSGGIHLVQSQAKGLDVVINEGGRGLSGGQKQILLLARMLVRQPQILLMDEPTASLDDSMEQYVIHQLKNWLGNRSFIVVTHRMPILNLVDRIIVVDRGQIVMDGPRQEVLNQLTRPQQAAGQQPPAHQPQSSAKENAV